MGYFIYSTMTKFLKPGKVAIITHGRYAGRKAIIVKSFDHGSPTKRFSHSLVVGLSKIPRKITKKQPTSVKKNKLSIKVFFKMVNHSHLMLTRYYFTRSDVDLIKSSVFTPPLPTSSITTRTVYQKKIMLKRYWKKSVEQENIDGFLKNFDFK